MQYVQLQVAKFVKEIFICRGLSVYYPRLSRIVKYIKRILQLFANIASWVISSMQEASLYVLLAALFVITQLHVINVK